MPAPLNQPQDGEARLTLVFRGVDDLTPELANEIYAATDGDCEIGMRDLVLYVELPAARGASWQRTPRILDAVQRVTATAELVRVEAADMVTATERSAEPLQPATR